MQNEGLISPNLQTILFQVLNFVVLAAGLYYLVFRPVRRSMKERAAEREREREELEESRAQAVELRDDLEEKLAHAEERSDEIVAEAKEQAEEARRELMAEAEAEAEDILAEAHAEAEDMRQQAIDDFQAELLDTIVAVSTHVIGQVLPREAHDALIRQMTDRIWEMGREEMTRVESFRRSLGERVPTAHVAVARELSREQRGLLVRTLEALADRQVDLDTMVDSSLGGGVRVRLGDVIVDNTIAGKLADLRSSMAVMVDEQLGDE